MTGKTRRYTLAEIKARSTEHFFDRATMKFFARSGFAGGSGTQQTKYGTRYDSETGQNYVIVTDPWGKRHFHKFHVESGKITPVRAEDVPTKIREE